MGVGVGGMRLRGALTAVRKGFREQAVAACLECRKRVLNLRREVVITNEHTCSWGKQ